MDEIKRLRRWLRRARSAPAMESVRLHGRPHVKEEAGSPVPAPLAALPFSVFA